MKRKIDVQDLRPGMYISELDRPWKETPFLLQGLELRSWQDVEEVKRYCRHVFILMREEAVALRSYFPERLVDTPTFTLVEIDPEQATAAKKLAPLPTQPFYQDSLQLEEEIQQAAEIERQTRELVCTMMEDVRLGKSLNFVAARKCVSEMVDSMIRNPDALVWFTHLKNKDEYSAFHSLRTSILSLNLGRQLELPKEALHILGVGALMHDIGKVKIPNELLNKPGRLTEPEYALVQGHVTHGVEILNKIRDMPFQAIELAQQHHERQDGSGYPGRLKEGEIGQFAMICAIADYYDSATSDQAYRPDLSSHNILNQMYDLRDRHFHPGLVEQFIQCMGVYPIGSIVELNTGSVGVVITVNRTRRLRPRVALVLKPDKRPYEQPVYIDLMRQPEQAADRLEIRKVLAPRSYGINPLDYLP